MLIIISFNSKLVRLKAAVRLCGCAVAARFNSKLVRLKGPGDGFFFEGDVTRFNSKLVRLKAGGGFAAVLRDWFQFQTGAIKSRVISTRLLRRSRVSIPNWCD